MLIHINEKLNGKIEIISFVVKFVLSRTSHDLDNRYGISVSQMTMYTDNMPKDRGQTIVYNTLLKN
jgi:hypothetical protein